MGDERMPDLFCHSLERKGFLQDRKARLDAAVRYCRNCNNCVKSGNVEGWIECHSREMSGYSGHATAPNYPNKKKMIPASLLVQ